MMHHIDISLEQYYETVNYFGDKPNLDDVPMALLLSKALERLSEDFAEIPQKRKRLTFFLSRKNSLKLVFDEGCYQRIKGRYLADERMMGEILPRLLSLFIDLSCKEKDLLLGFAKQ